jgi:hypothetical protein
MKQIYLTTSIFKWLEEVFKPIDFYFIYRSKQFTQLALRKAFPGKPDDIWFGKVHKKTACIFSKWHFCFDQLQEDIVIRMNVFASFLIFINHGICLYVEFKRYSHR